MELVYIPGALEAYAMGELDEYFPDIRLHPVEYRKIIFLGRYEGCKGYFRCFLTCKGSFETGFETKVEVEDDFFRIEETGPSDDPEHHLKFVISCLATYLEENNSKYVRDLYESSCRS